MHVRRLWWRLFVAYLWVPVGVLLAIGWQGSAVVRELYLNQVEDDLEARARLAAAPIAEALARGETAAVDRFCKELGSATGTRITVVLPSGKVAGDSDTAPSDMDNHGERPEVREALAGNVGRSLRYSSTEQEEHLYKAVPIVRGHAVVAVVRTSLPLTELARTLSLVRRQILTAVGAGILFHALVTVLISRRMSRPLEEIRAGAERFAAGELDYRLRIADSVEIDAVARTMNRMAEQLDERIQTVLHQQNEREAMLASMEEGVLAINQDGLILGLNQACAGLLGEELARLQGRSVYEAVRKADLLEFVERALVNSSPVEGEFRIRGPQDRWVNAHGTALNNAQGEKIGVMVVLHDITRLRHLEEVRRDFVANVSHELRTPITSLKGFIETLADGALEDKENVHRFLQIMLRQVNRLDAIIRDLLTLSRIERGSEEQRIELSRESIGEVLSAAVQMCQRKAAQKTIQVQLACPEGLSGEINPALLEQAVVNLLDNAIQYSAPQGTVKLSADCEDGQIVIRVKDRGCGIEPQHLPRLFERFYRVDKARSRELGGTGLGLAIVRHIVLAHRGSVDVQSKVGEGSTFALRLPASSPTSGAQPCPIA